MRYRRARVSGGTFFFTVVTADRRPFLCDGNYPARLRAAIDRIRGVHPLTIEALVLLPDHLHCIWALPNGDADFSARWMLIKSEFTRRCRTADVSSTAKHATRGRAMWQSRFWEHCIRDEDDLVRHVDYIHFNPVKHGHASRPEEWAFSSIHRYIRDGILPPGWASDPKLDTVPE